ncbi:MAG: aminotransferase class V-fold PLP-dependent enzyme [Flavobacteriales bacterium]|nr:aminotransferase class V-fold PLP-dependent enzyme [Flavobacteriales bacterium]
MSADVYERILLSLGEEEPSQGAVVPPVFHSVNYAGHSVEALARKLANEFDEPLYTRGNNPTVALLRKKMAALEGAEDSLFFASGSAAMAATVLSYVKAGDHILCVQEAYTWTTRLVRDFLPNLGVEFTFSPGYPTENFLASLRPNTRLVILETPTSLFFRVQDVEAICGRCKEREIPVVVDNSYCTPMAQKPLLWGADAVVHSATKYINGHGDVVAGVVCSSQERIRHIFYGPFMTLGATLSASDASQILRGMRTLPLRFQRSCQTALYIMEKVRNHPAVTKIWHPWYASDEEKALARKQMRLPGGMFTLEFRCKYRESLEKAFSRLRFFKLAVSWGGYESLALPFAAFPPRNQLPWNMARFYCGLDDPDDLLHDILNVLENIE